MLVFMRVWHLKLKQNILSKNIFETANFAIILITMSQSVAQKDPTTGRIEQISEFLANRRDLINDNFEILLNNGGDETKVEPTSKIMSDLKIKVEELSTDIVKHKLIQISGM